MQIAKEEIIPGIEAKIEKTVDSINKEETFTSVTKNYLGKV